MSGLVPPPPRFLRCVANDTHRPVDHGDGKEPWCARCKFTEEGYLPQPL